MTEIPEAKEMRARLIALDKAKRAAQLHDLHKRIHRAVETAKCSIRVQRWEPGVREIVESKGYAVTHHPALDQRDTDEWEVSW